jgi:hypothetical protein
MEKQRINNFIRLTASDGGKRYRVLMDDAGNELGIEVSGVLTTFGDVNENGFIFERGSYDRSVEKYFEANKLNVPLCLYHDDANPDTLCGIVTTLEKTERGIEITARIKPNSAKLYKFIKAQLDDGILQGFSNAGFIADGFYDESAQAVRVKDFELIHAALVATPADTGATLRTVNTIFKGFEKQTEPAAERTEAVEEPIDNEVNPDGWQW